jgi:RNA polymerase primary sigma factor
MGVKVVQNEEATSDEEKDREEEEKEEPEGDNELVEVLQNKVPAKAATKEPTERSDDPVRMYLREMGTVELLSREGEIAIAKRIEAGREAMIAGLCESPLTFQAIIIWRDELNEGKVFLRDIIDLEATYAGPNAKAMPAPVVIGPDGQPVVPVSGAPIFGAQPPQAPATAPDAATPFKPASEHGDGEESPAERAAGEGDLDEDDMENWLSLAAIEAELKPKVVETFDTVAGTYRRLRRLQDQDIQFQLKSLSLSPAQERKYKKLKDEIVAPR